jgi:type I restriction enzyme S subunit
MSKNVGIGRNYEVPDDWMVTTIESNITDIGDGGTPDTNFQRYFGGNIRWAKVDDIKFKISDTKNYLTQEGLDNSSAKLWPEGSVIVTTGATIGKVGISQEPIATKQGITGIVTNHNLESRYLAYFLISEKETLVRFAQGGTFEEIRPHILKRLRIPLPPLPEQRRIAEILSTVDELIQQTDAVIEETERLKRGLMQDLLTKGIGQNTYRPVKIGPKTIEIPSEWEVRKLDELTRNSGNYGANVSAVEYDPEMPRYIRITDIGDNGFLKNNDRKSISRQNAEGYYLSAGDLLFARTGATTGKSYVCRQRDSDAAYAGYLIRFELDESEVDIDFLALYVQSKPYHDWVGRMTRHGAQQNINASEYRSLDVLYPPLPEQRRIAEILTTVDATIQRERETKMKLESLRRGLMQDLLTGKVRVPVET